jgi:predicted nucleic acid-binding protein
MALVVDTGPILAFLDYTDPDHASCLKLFESTRERLILPAPVLVEVDYWISRGLDKRASLTLLQDVERGAYEVEDLRREDYSRIIQLIQTYADTPIGFVDAAVLAVVERLNEPKLATLDHRHFGMLRPRHVDALQLLPEL